MAKQFILWQIFLSPQLFQLSYSYIVIFNYFTLAVTFFYLSLAIVSCAFVIFITLFSIYLKVKIIFISVLALLKYS